MDVIGRVEGQSHYASMHAVVNSRLIRIAPCVLDQMHTGALFRVFSKSCKFLRDSQNPAVFLPPKCTWEYFCQYHLHTGVLFKKKICKMHTVHEFDFLAGAYQHVQDVRCQSHCTVVTLSPGDLEQC